MSAERKGRADGSSVNSAAASNEALRDAVFDGVANLSGYAAMTTPDGDIAAADLNGDAGIWLIQIKPAKLVVNDG